MPTKEQVDKALQLMSKGSAAYDYFFRKLDDPAWIAPLDNRGLFNAPPRASRDDENRVIGASWWPQSKFLARMALKAPELVLGISLKVKTDNHFVILDFTEAALQMPHALAAEWAKHIINWLQAGNTTFSILEKDLGKLISKLAKENEIDVALALAAELLAVLPDPDTEDKQHPKDQAEEIIYSSLNPKIRCDKYYYDQILEQNIPDLAAVAPFETMGLLCELNLKATLYSLKDPEEAKPYDMSNATRPAIENHGQNHDYQFQHKLITALRNVAQSICCEDAGKLPEVIKMLESYEWDIFCRIGLYLLQVIDPVPMDMVRDRLVNEYLFKYTGVYHEYYHLLSRRFDQLKSEDQDTILSWIDSAEPEKHFIEKHEKGLSSEQQNGRIRYWQWRKLSAIQVYLTGDRLALFEGMQIEYGDANMHPDFLSWMSSTWVGPQSPKTPEELAQLTKEDIIRYLKEWKPSGNWMSPTPDGLGSALGKLVEKEPEEYANNIGLFMDNNMGPTYVKHLLRGFCHVLESGINIPYAQVFKLCKWVVDKPTKMPDREIPKGLRGDLEMDVDWRQTKSEIAQLCEKVFSDKLDFPYALREQIWAIIEPLTHDPEPSAEYEAKFGGDNMDPLTLSINTIRGKAMHSVMSYAMWIYRTIKDELKQNDDRSPQFSDMPEVLSILAEHLDTSSDHGSNQTDRAIYGKWLPQLVSIDEKWVEENINSIFPTEQDFRPLRVAAWHSYLMYTGQLYKQVTRLLRGIYAEEIELLDGKETVEDSYKSLDTRLVEHVCLFYGWGDSTLNEGDLVDRLFRVASPVLTQHAMAFLGRNMNSKLPKNPELSARLQDLWEWRIQMCGGVDSMPEKELSAFGWWFSGGCFDPVWAFQNLEAVLTRTSVTRSNLFVFEYMSSIFQDYPDESLRCIRLFIEKNDDPWFFVSNSKQKGIWTILEQGLRNAHADVRSESESLVHLLGAKGHLEYRSLLNHNPSVE